MYALNTKSRQAEKRVRNCLGSMLTKWPFFATLAMHTPLTENHKVKSIACDGTTLFYNPEWILETVPDDIRQAIAAVVLACGLDHHTRRGERDYGKWQRASKMVRLPFMREAGFTDDPGGVDMSIEECYDMLPDSEESDECDDQDGDGQSEGVDLMPGAGLPPPGGNDQQGESEGDSGGDSQDQDGSGGGEGQQPPPSQDPDGKGEVLDAPGTQGGEGGASKGEIENAIKEQEQKWNQAMHQAAAISKSQGLMPGGIEELIDGAHESEVDWRVLLHRFMQRVAERDYTWQRPNRRHIDSGLYLPAIHSEQMPPIVIAVDSSGSMDQDDLDAAWKETCEATQEARPEKVTVIQCDARIQDVEEFAPDELLDADFLAHGRGGTRVAPVFEYVEQELEPPACLIYFSDMEFSDCPEEEPPYPVLWVGVKSHRWNKTFTDDDLPPWGEFLEVESGNLPPRGEFLEVESGNES